MAERTDKWQRDWHTGAWASARCIWLRPSPEDESLDDEVWRAACDDPGSPLAVFLVELRQLLADLLRIDTGPVVKDAGASESHPVEPLSKEHH